MVDIPAVMAALASDRPIYHSEADFQHAFAWELHRRLSEAKVRLEYRIETEKGTIHLDLLVVREEERLAIEFKYKTRSLATVSGGEKYKLASQSAQDLGRYDFLKDIGRLERIVESEPRTSGCAILLTNDQTYWAPSGQRQTVDSAFRLDEGRELEGDLRWGDKASPGTTRGRELPLQLRAKYRLNWREFSNSVDVPGSRFRYLALGVPASLRRG